MQCCPMDTYSGRTKLDLHGNEVEIADCSCGDGCQCHCLECACPWPDDDGPACGEPGCCDGDPF